MDGSRHEASAAGQLSDLTLHEAAEQYAISARTLAQHIRCGQLPAYKTAGATGREWRITRDALDAAGYPARQPPPTDSAAEPALVRDLRRELNAARRAAAAERRKAEDTDRRLGQALLECGRLRAALAKANGEQDTVPQLDLTSAEARWVVNSFSGVATGERQPQEQD